VAEQSLVEDKFSAPLSRRARALRQSPARRRLELALRRQPVFIGVTVDFPAFQIQLVGAIGDRVVNRLPLVAGL
jgi:hypothetical protein